MKDLILSHIHESRVMAEEFPELSVAGIQWVGFSRVHGSHTRRSLESERCMAHLQVTVSGEARGLVNGRWVNMPTNTAYVMPCGADWAWRYDAKSGVPWEVLFVRLLPGMRTAIPVGCDKPYVIRDRDPGDLIWAFQRMYQESLTKGRPAILTSLSEMIAYHAREILDEGAHICRLSDLWMSVAKDLARPWDLAMLCRDSLMSYEKLRMLSRKETGRSPMAQVTWLRMRRATELLEGSLFNVQEIGNLVGYDNPFNFSRAFKHLYGFSPSGYRKRIAAGEGK